jgi:hypothetical protein
MTPSQRCAATFLLAFACLALAVSSARAATAGTFSATLTNETGGPAAGARILLTSPNATFEARSGADGRAALDSVPAGVYRIVIEGKGYFRYTLENVSVTAGQTVLLIVALRTAPPTAAMRPPEPAGDGSPAVHNSLLGLFNASHPVHAEREPYYGRYSYVLLHDGDDRQKAKNRAFVTKLVDLFAASGSAIDFFNAARSDSPPNPLAYNIFFFPVSAATSAIKVIAHAGAAETILAAYDYGASRDMRDAYCAEPAHGSRSLCSVPYGNGPVLLTFLRPLPASLTGLALPPAFAYDFTLVSPEQFDGPLQTVQRKIALPAGIAADQILPPALAAHVANELDLLSTALSASLSGVKVWIDKQFGTPHGA